jgi:hypothetical protein
MVVPAALFLFAMGGADAKSLHVGCGHRAPACGAPRGRFLKTGFAAPARAGRR